MMRQQSESDGLAVVSWSIEVRKEYWRRDEIVSIPQRRDVRGCRRRLSKEKNRRRSNVQIMYQDGNHVISVKSDDDVETMMEEWETVRGRYEEVENIRR